MGRYKYVLIWCLLVGTLVSCNSEGDPQPSLSSAQDYQPLTAGSTWSYGGDIPFTMTATGITRSFSSRTFHVMESNYGKRVSKSFMLREGGIYTAIGMQADMGDLEMKILKEDASVGETWYQENRINGVDVKRIFTIVQKGGSKRVEGKKYRNVVGVKVQTTRAIAGVDLKINTTTHYYWAKGIGLILTDYGALGKVPLLDHTVK